MNLISMVLFGTQTRYWYTLLPAIVANLELYPGWNVRLHVANDVRSHPASSLLDKLSDGLGGRFQVFEYPDQYRDQEPSMWRMRPLWDPNVERFMCRDVDSVPSTHEIQAVRIWLRTNYPVQSIRSYHLHTTLLMAGLCGFHNPSLQPLRDQVPSWDAYVQRYVAHAQGTAFSWGCDQEMLRMMFGGVVPMILDFPIGDCAYHHLASGIPHVPKEETYAESVFDLPADLLSVCDEITKVPWGEFEGFAGRPHGDFRPYLSRMLSVPTQTGSVVNAILDENPDIKKFYDPNV